MAGEVSGMGAGGSGLTGQLLAGLMYIINYMLSSLSTILAWFGLNFKPSENSILTLITAVIVLAALFDYFLRLSGKWLYNSIAGFAGLLLLHYVFGVSIPITLFTVIAVAVFGVPGLLAIIILHIGGIL